MNIEISLIAMVRNLLVRKYMLRYWYWFQKMPYKKYAEFIGFDYLKFDIKVSNSKIYHIKFPFSPEKICMYIDPNKKFVSLFKLYYFNQI